MSRQLQKLIQRLNTLEREISEIRKAVTQEAKPFPEFPAIKQQQRQQEQAEEEEFICILCSVTKLIDQRERKGKQKSSACKQYANNRFKERRQKSKNDGTSQYESVCGSALNIKCILNRQPPRLMRATTDQNCPME